MDAGEAGRSLAVYKSHPGADCGCHSVHRAQGSLHSTSVIPALGLWRQEDGSEVKVIPGYIMSSSPTWATQDSGSKN